MYQRLAERQAKSLGSCRTDAQSRKGTGTSCHGNGVDGVQIQFDHIGNLVQHGEQGLGMGLLVVDRVLRQEIAIGAVILYHCHGRHQS